MTVGSLNPRWTTGACDVCGSLGADSMDNRPGTMCMVLGIHLCGLCLGTFRNNLKSTLDEEPRFIPAHLT